MSTFCPISLMVNFLAISYLHLRTCQLFQEHGGVFQNIDMELHAALQFSPEFSKYKINKIICLDWCSQNISEEMY